MVLLISESQTIFHLHLHLLLLCRLQPRLQNSYLLRIHLQKIQLRHKGMQIPEGGRCSEPKLTIGVAVSLLPFSATSIHILPTMFPSLFSSSSAHVCICLSSSVPSSYNTSNLPAAPLSLLLSNLPDAIISLSPQHLSLSSIHAISAISYPYTPTHTPPIYLTPL